MLLVHKSVVEVNGRNGVDLGVKGCVGVAVAEQNVVEPRGNDNVGVHEVSDALKYRFEVVFLGLAFHDDVECVVHRRVDGAALLSLNIKLVLCRVKEHAEGALIPARQTGMLPVVAVPDLVVLPEISDDLAASDVLQTIVLFRLCLRVGGVLAHLVLGPDCEEKKHVVLTEVLPLFPKPVVPAPSDVVRNLRGDKCGLVLPKIGCSDGAYREGLDG
mmetsp:Transcript_41865/g.102161  ORF Transcript_41865/g.102161 Transcript_41865/m.102161 type:complete len:216 (+) Transcript_41865:1962-2609(+)